MKVEQELTKSVKRMLSMWKRGGKDVWEEGEKSQHERCGAREVAVLRTERKLMTIFSFIS